jgi:hypothetical protein
VGGAYASDFDHTSFEKTRARHNGCHLLRMFQKLPQEHNPLTVLVTQLQGTRHTPPLSYPQ